MKKISFIFIFLLLGFTLLVSAQGRTAFVSGPMLGAVELRSAKIWCEVTPETNKVTLTIRKQGNAQPVSTIVYQGRLGQPNNPVLFETGGLDFNTTYTYEIEARAANQVHKKTGQFTTTDLWQYRKNFPDFTFIAGSCSYMNEPKVDRVFVEMINPSTPARPYGGDSSIFETMAKEKAAFMLWLGDNWYYREVDYGSPSGLRYRASYDRSRPVVQNLLKAMPNYAIWDDHDYGPNDADKSYVLKEAALEVFKSYWANPSYGHNGQGIYTKFSYSDADFFLMDDRWFRSNDHLQDSINGKPNPDKRMWGPQQMEWLRNALKQSLANFKIIVTGSQVLNPVSPFDRLLDHPIEYSELMDFLAREKINGVIFFSGDRHHSEIIKQERPGLYTLYDVTSSPLTSGVAKAQGAEANNPARIPGTLIEAQNYSRVSITGGPRERVLKVEYVDVKGQKLGEWSIRASDLRNSR
ncbi:MAG TPA: alkaline phosphatase D family protein [Chitinophagaceae bacterium]|nr:alkaline phosphatase D family protein [Chitinophagaceae bacterium]